MSFHHVRNESRYAVETPDGIVPASGQASTILRYRDTNISAGICFEGTGYRTVVLGFPIEALTREEDIQNILTASMAFFRTPPEEPETKH